MEELNKEAFIKELNQRIFNYVNLEKGKSYQIPIETDYLIDLSYNELIALRNEIKKSSDIELKKILANCLNVYRRKMRYKERFYKLACIASNENLFFNNDYKLIFYTQTLSNDYITKYTERPDKLIRIMKQFLNKYCKYYMFNLDYGEKNGRLHCHCLCLIENKYLISLGEIEPHESKIIYNSDYHKIENIVFNIPNHDYLKIGGYDIEPICSDPTSWERTFNYVYGKITDHGFKDSVNNLKIIYCKNKLHELDILYLTEIKAFLHHWSNVSDSVLNIYSKEKQANINIYINRMYKEPYNNYNLKVLHDIKKNSLIFRNS